MLGRRCWLQVKTKPFELMQQASPEQGGSFHLLWQVTTSKLTYSSVAAKLKRRPDSFLRGQQKAARLACSVRENIVVTGDYPTLLQGQGLSIPS